MLKVEHNGNRTHWRKGLQLPCPDPPTPHEVSVIELCAVIEGLKAELRRKDRWIMWAQRKIPGYSK